MSFNQGPIFSGKPGEDVELYINQCRIQWIPLTLSDEDRNMAISTTIQTGLRDSAARYVRGLPKEEKSNWETLRDRLIEKLETKEDEDREITIMQRISDLRQGTQTLKDYFQVARDLEYQLPPGAAWLPLLLRSVVNGLNDSMSRKVLLSSLKLRKDSGEEMSLESLQQLANELENGST